jgi:excisionase family DNA binding protein
MSDGAATPWLVVREAADRAKVSVKCVYRAVEAQQLRAARVGGRRSLRFRPEWVDSWLEGTTKPIEIDL